MAVVVASLLPTSVYGAEPAAAGGIARFEDTCFGDFNDAEPYPTPEDIRKVFVPAAPRSAILARTGRELAIGYREITRAAGLFRLKPRWKPDTTLRLSLLNPELTYFHFWCGQEGVHLRYCPPAEKSWGAYHIRRRDLQPFPTDYADWGVDNGRYRRAGLGTFEIRWHEGRIVLTRGDLVLLRVPLATPPEEVYFSTEALIRGVSVYRSGYGPPLPEPSPTVLKLDRPGEADWAFEQAAGITFEKSPEGPVCLKASPGSKAADASIAIPRPGVFEYIFQLSEPEPGTGIFLGDAAGKHLARLAFYRDRSTGRTTFAYLRPRASETELEYSFDRSIVPYAGHRQWLRLTLGAGVLKAWTSGDGRCWSQAVWAPMPIQGPVRRIGLYCVPAEHSRSIQLETFELCRPRAMASLVEEDLLEQAASNPGLGDVETLEDWQRCVGDARPPGISASAWQRACILSTLAENPYFSLGSQLIHRLLDEALEEPRDPAQKLELLEGAAVLVHNLDEEATAPFARHYERIGMQMLAHGQGDPLDALRPAILRLPLWNDRRQNAWPARVLRHELLRLAVGQHWDALEKLLESLRFWTRTERLVGGQLPWDRGTEYAIRWAEWTLAEHRSQEPPPEIAATGPVPACGLLESFNRATYNVLTDVQAALAADMPQEAASAIVRSSRSDRTGLLPAPEDARLQVSLRAVVETAIADSEDLKSAMLEEFATLGELRLGKAITAGEAIGVEAVTVQFFGTPAAAEAHAWLGRRALSAGRAAAAVGHFRQALRFSVPDRTADWQAGLRLAGAMLGRDLGPPVREPVCLGADPVAPEEFEAMVAAMRSARSNCNADQPASSSPDPAFAAETATRVRLCEPSSMPGRFPAVARDTAWPRADWIGRRIAAAHDGTRLLIASQHEVIALSATTGKRVWSRSLAEDGVAPNKHLGAMRPVVTGKHVLVRRLTDRGPALACFDVEDGRLLWESGCRGYAVSDPLCLGQELSVAAAEPQAGQTVLRLLSLDARSGRVLAGNRLAEFRDDCGLLLSCRATAADGRIVATVSGCVLCCDTSGRVDWIRRQPYLPPPQPTRGRRGHREIAWDARPQQPPLVVDGRVLATQPGVWCVECLDLATGRLAWRRAIPELTAVVGEHQGRVFVQTRDTVLAVDLVSGVTRWIYDGLPAPLGVGRCDTVGSVSFVATAEPIRAGQPAPLLWVALDSATGRPKTTQALGLSVAEDTLVGSLVGGGGRYWLPMGTTREPHCCEVVELAFDSKPGRRPSDSSAGPQ